VQTDDLDIANLKFLLLCFESMSGLRINFHKSEVMVLGTTNFESQRIANMLNCKLWAPSPLPTLVFRLVTWGSLLGTGNPLPPRWKSARNPGWVSSCHPPLDSRLSTPVFPAFPCILWMFVSWAKGSISSLTDTVLVSTGMLTGVATNTTGCGGRPCASQRSWAV
jgi:hypothetical protein